MNIIIEGIKEAFRLIFSLDAEVFEVVLLSLRVSLTSLLVRRGVGDISWYFDSKISVSDEASVDAFDLYTDGDASGALRSFGLYLLHAQRTFGKPAVELYGDDHDHRANIDDLADHYRTDDQCGRRKAG